jgi:hypothetical protein
MVTVLRVSVNLWLSLVRRFEKLKALGLVIQCGPMLKSHERWFER